MARRGAPPGATPKPILELSLKDKLALVAGAVYKHTPGLTYDQAVKHAVGTALLIIAEVDRG